MPETYHVTKDKARALFENEDVQDVASDLHEVFSSNTVDDMADAARRGLTRLTLKNKGSVNHDRKSKSLRERWPTKEPKPVQAGDSVAALKAKVSAVTTDYFNLKLCSKG